MDERRLELKVGALALLALAVGAGLLVALLGLPGGSPFRAYADFGYAGGLPSGAHVKIAGVKVGRVRRVEFRPTSRDAEGRPLPVRLELEIERDAATALRADASCTVGTQGALGESYLEVLPGEAPAPFAEGTAMRGLDPPRLDVLLAKFFALLESAATDEAFRSFLVTVARLATTIDELLVNNKAELAGLFRDLGKVLGDGRAAMEDVRVAARSANALMSSPELRAALDDLAVSAKAARAELPQLLADARSAVASLEKTAGALTPEDVAKVRSTLARLETVTASLQKVSAGADQLLTGVQKGEGTLGKLAKDPKVYDDLRALLADIKANPWKLVWKD